MSNGSPDYTRRVILYAWDGTAFVPVLVDDKGNIISVFKGQYGTTLQTVKVDDEGRIIALVTDELDIYENKVIVGNAELAVRLGSEKFFDRRGDTYLIDNFESGVGKWDLAGAGTGNEQVLSADRARSGGYSIKLVGGSTSAYNARMYNYFPYPILSKWGFEVHFSIPQGFDYIVFEITLFTGTHSKLAKITYDRDNKTIQCLGSDGNDHDINTSFFFYESSYLFHVFKLVADLVDSKYVRLITNETTHDLSAYGMYSDTSDYSKHIRLGIFLYSRDGQNDSVYIDNIIVTQNEPD